MPARGAPGPPPGMEETAKRIAASQTRALAAAWAVVRADAFENRHPADRALAEFFRKHPEFGGRDRSGDADL